MLIEADRREMIRRKFVGIGNPASWGQKGFSQSAGCSEY